MKRIKLFSSVTLGIVLLDQVTKYLVRAQIPLHNKIELTPFLTLTHIENTGITFGLFQGASIIWMVVALAIIGFILHQYKTLVTSKATAGAFGAILGGAIGNLIDRMLFGAVTDFISVGWWPAFNVADTAISASALFLIYLWWE